MLYFIATAPVVTPQTLDDLTEAHQTLLDASTLPQPHSMYIYTRHLHSRRTCGVLITIQRIKKCVVSRFEIRRSIRIVFVVPSFNFFKRRYGRIGYILVFRHDLRDNHLYQK